MGLCRGCVRMLLFVFNFLMWLLGCALLSVGIWIKLDDGAKHHVETLTHKVDAKYQISYSSVGEEDMTPTLAYLLIVFGIVLILITFIGCCGAVRENQCMLMTYAICLFVLMCAVLGIGAWAYNKREDINTQTAQLRNTTDANIKKAVDDYYGKSGMSKNFMDNVQHRFQCCGMGRGLKDYNRNHAPQICTDVVKTQSYDCRDPYYVYVADEIKDFLYERYTIIASVCFAVTCCLALGVIFAFCFCCIVRQTTVITVN